MKSLSIILGLIVLCGYIGITTLILSMIPALTTQVLVGMLFYIPPIIVIVQSFKEYVTQEPANHVDKDSNMTTVPSTKRYPVSEEQMSIFQKNWTLLEFRKEFGKENRIKDCINSYSFIPYKCCIFGKKVWVRFASSLGELSLKEIKSREKELMIGLSKEKKNYVLYDNKITKYEIIESEPIDLFEETNTEILEDKSIDNINKGKGSQDKIKGDSKTIIKNATVLETSKKIEENIIDKKLIQSIKESQNENNPDPNALTKEQRQALLGLALVLCDKYCISNHRSQVNKIIQEYKTSLELNNIQLTYISGKQTWKDRDSYIEIVKSLKGSVEYTKFINVCKKLFPLGNDNIFIDHNFAYIFRGLGYTNDEILEIEKSTS